ncbi:MAG: carboxypeptidase-like regulatory domain-containing protein, partial [Pirellulales bacterium]
SRHDGWQKLDHGLRSPLDVVIRAVSDGDGRFELRGVGIERLASLEILAAGHAADQFYVVNRPGFDAGKYNDIITEFETPFARQNELHPRLAGPKLDYIAEDELVIRGKVFTGPDQTPVSGAVVESYGRGQGQILSARTDEQGRYELHGSPRNRQYPLSVRRSTGSDFLPRTVTLATAPGQTAIDLDLELKRGIVVEGRVFDQETGHGLKGGVRFVPLPGNDFAKKPGFDGPLHNRVSENTDEEGRFRLLVIPGPGVLLGSAYRGEVQVGGHKIQPYRQATFSEADCKRVMPTEDADDRHFTAADNSVEFLGSHNAARFLDLPPDAAPFHCDLSVDRGKTVEVSLEDEEGRPVHDAFVSGLADCWRFTYRIAEPTCIIYALGADRPRRVCILHPERRLAASLTLTGDEAGPVKVRLGAAAIITGRALESNGEPIADAVVQINYARLSAREIDRFVELEHPAVKTDAEGRFQVDNIVTGERFALDFRQEQHYFRANLTDEQRQLKAGQKLELGEMKVTQLR